LSKVATTGVRNAGTLAGNLMLKHAHPEFPSDIFALFEAANGKLIVRSPSDEVVVSPLEFLALDMTKVTYDKFFLSFLN
jgi:xanthine dehydrogenase/oxidase